MDKEHRELLDEKWQLGKQYMQRGVASYFTPANPLQLALTLGLTAAFVGPVFIFYTRHGRIDYKQLFEAGAFLFAYTTVKEVYLDYYQAKYES